MDTSENLSNGASIVPISLRQGTFMKQPLLLAQILLGLLTSGPAVLAEDVPTPAGTAAQITPAREALPDGSEVAIILSRDRFFPSQIRIRAGMPTTLVFTTVNKKPAALVIERAAGQRSLASAEPSLDRATQPTEITRELGNDRVTTISFDPAQGKYGFHDALGAARGEIIVE